MAFSVSCVDDERFVALKFYDTHLIRSLSLYVFRSMNNNHSTNTKKTESTDCFRYHICRQKWKGETIVRFILCFGSYGLICRFIQSA